MKTFFKNRFQDKVMIITGASRGIGKETALRASKEGAKVVLVDLLDEAQEAADEITYQGGEALFIKANLVKEEEVEALVKKTVDTFQKVDILINNAGVTCTPNALSLTAQKDFDFTFRTNVYSVFLYSKHVITQFLKQNSGGAIVNTASMGGLAGLPSMPAYVSSKHAINGLTKNMAIDYAKYGIRVNSINPAQTATPMQQEGYKMAQEKIKKAVASGAMKKEDVLSLMGDKANNLQHRILDADEQAASILFLASDDASYLTGCTLQTDAGWTAF